MAKNYRDAVKFFAIDCERNSKACEKVEKDIKKYPHIIFMGPKGQTDKFTYAGDSPTEKNAG